MKKQLKTYLFEKWWVPLLTFIVSSIFLLSLISSTNDSLLNISDYFYLFTVILLFIAGIWQLLKGKWYLGLLQLGILFIGFVVLIYIATFMTMFGPDTDTFADNIELPENINLEEPIDLNMDDNLEGIRHDINLSKKITEIDFQIYSSFQPGLYEYDV